MQPAVRVQLTDTADKVITLPTETGAVTMGMHDELAEFYGAPSGDAPHASTLDYVIAATGACLAGTFKRALAARGITAPPDAFSIEATGDIVVEGDVPVIRRIHVRYVLAGTDPSDRATIERAHSVHKRACAVSRSIGSAIDIETGLTLV